MKHTLTDIPGIGESTAAALAEHGIDSIKALQKAGMKGLMQVPGFGEARAANVLNAAEALKHGKPEKGEKEKKAKVDKKSKKTKKDKSADKSKKKKNGKKNKKKKKK